MKIIKGLALVFFLITILGSCFDAPEYDIVPEIEFRRIEYVPRKNIDQTDSLNVYIDFKDGDGDLGALNDEEQVSFYFIESGGVLSKISTKAVTENATGIIYNRLDIPENYTLVNFKSRFRIPSIPQEYTCQYYNIIPLTSNYIIDKADINAFNPKKTFSIEDITINEEEYLHFSDTLYSETTSNFYNYYIDILKREPENPHADPLGYVLIDECLGEDGRFDALSSNENTAIEGTLKHALLRGDYRTVFGTSPIKLRIQIFDRAQHGSNVIETPEFTLDGILKK